MPPSRLNALWGAEIARASGIFGWRLFPGARTQALARAELMAALPAAHTYLIGASRTAAEILRQQMVLNAVHDAGEQWASETGNAAALRAYTEARAETQTVSAYRAIGRQAETWVPMLRIVFECLYVGAFPMAVLLMLTPAGGAIFRSYFSGLVWLQSWGPLYAVLHRISMGEAAERMSAGALMPGGDVGVSLVAQAGIQAVASDVAVMSGYLSMSVPFLAAALAYGVGRATALATSVLAVGQDAASSAAQEGTTGNVSLANTQSDTHRFATVEGHQVRTSLHADTDRYTGFAPGGAGFTVTGDGAVVADAGSATSRIPAAGVRLSESLATSHENRANAAREQARHWSAEAATARTAVATDSAALVERFSRDVNTGVAHSRGVTESESQRVQSLESHYKRLSEAGGITREQAAALTSEAKAGGGFDFIVKFGADGSVSWRGHTIEPGGLEPDDRLCRAAERARRLVAGGRGLEALLHGFRGERAQEPGGEFRSQLDADAPLRRAGGHKPPRSRELEPAGGRGAEPRSNHRPGAGPALLQLAHAPAQAPTGGRSAWRAPCAWRSPRPRRTPRSCGATPPPSSRRGFPLPGARTRPRRRIWRTTSGPVRGFGSRAGAGPPRPGRNGRAGPGRRGAEAAGTRGEASDERRESGAPRPTPSSISGRRNARRGVVVAGERSERGRARVAAETGRPFGEHAAESVPLVGEWLGGRLYGTAPNAAPDAGGKKERARGGPMGGTKCLGRDRHGPAGGTREREDR